MIDTATKAERRGNAAARLLRMHHESRVGHIGGNLSSLDILMSLYHDTLTDDDHFILSKGHAAGALYVALWSIGRLSEDDLKTFHGDGTLLSGHPPAGGIDDIPFATGSLGHGLGLACGIALAKQLRRAPGRIFCLTSDGEWNEGSTWEALIFAAHRGLENLVIIVDLNGLQGFGGTREVANLEPLADKLRGFGAVTIEIDGHDQGALSAAFATSEAGPRAIVAHTVKGHGLSFMENRMDSHYLPLTDEQYAAALRELAAR